MDDVRVIEKIEQLVKDGLTVEVDGQEYSAAELTPVVWEPTPDTVQVHNLRGFCGFINNDIDKAITARDHLIIVNSPGSVDLVSATKGKAMKRTQLVEAKIAEGLKQFQFGKFMSQKEFAINFRSLFVKKDGDDFDYVLEYASKLTAGTQIDGDDDGIAQRVTVKRGVSGHLSEKVKLKAIVKLSPYRTFREVEQPESEFLLRVQNSGDVPNVALFEADGGAWINDATENIVGYIQSLVKEIPVIA